LELICSENNTFENDHFDFKKLIPIPFPYMIARMVRYIIRTIFCYHIVNGIRLESDKESLLVLIYFMTLSILFQDSRSKVQGWKQLQILKQNIF